MSRLNKTEEIIELAMMFQNSFCGLCIDDIQAHFECSRRSAERMKALLFDLFPEKIEEVPTSDKKKRWRFVKGTMNALIKFSANDFANLEYLKGLSNDENKKNEIDELIAKIKALTPQKNLQSLDTDVFAYPLNPNHYGTAEQVLQEAMAAGIVPLVMNNPAEKFLVKHNKTGLISENIEDFNKNLTILFENPELRKQLSKNC